MTGLTGTGDKLSPRAMRYYYAWEDAKLHAFPHRVVRQKWVRAQAGRTFAGTGNALVERLIRWGQVEYHGWRE